MDRLIDRLFRRRATPCILATGQKKNPNPTTILLLGSLHDDNVDVLAYPPPTPSPKKKKKEKQVSSQSHRLPHRTLKRQNSNFLPIPHFFLCKNILLQNIFDFFGRVGPREQDGAGHVERFLDATRTTTVDDGFAEIGSAPEEEVRGVVGEFGEMAAGGFDEREIPFFWV